MGILAYIILTIYTLALAYITIYCLLQLHLLYYYKRNQRQGAYVPRMRRTASEEVSSHPQAANSGFYLGGDSGDRRSLDGSDPR